jgi:hypothetical protein
VLATGLVALPLAGPEADAATATAVGKATPRYVVTPATNPRGGLGKKANKYTRHCYKLRSYAERLARRGH